MTEAALPSPVPDAVQAPARFDTLYLGYIRVEKEKGAFNVFFYNLESNFRIQSYFPDILSVDDFT